MQLKKKIFWMWRILAFSHVFIRIDKPLLANPKKKQTKKKKTTENKKKDLSKKFFGTQLEGMKGRCLRSLTKPSDEYQWQQNDEKVSCQFKSDSHTSHYNCRGTQEIIVTMFVYKPFKENLTKLKELRIPHTTEQCVYLLSVQVSCGCHQVKVILFTVTHSVQMIDQRSMQQSSWSCICRLGYTPRCVLGNNN